MWVLCASDSELRRDSQFGWLFSSPMNQAVDHSLIIVAHEAELLLQAVSTVQAESQYKAGHGTVHQYYVCV